MERLLDVPAAGRYPSEVVIDNVGIKRIVAMETWLSDNYDREVYSRVLRDTKIKIDTVSNIVYMFKNEEDAMAFKLRWA